MALINCPECNKQISDKASACPDCGCPMTPPISSVQTQTIEKTAKKYKALSLVAVLMIFIGFIVALSTCGSMDSNGPVYGAFLAILGLGIYIVNRIVIWWRHE